MGDVGMVGIDLAKQVFQVHGRREMETSCFARS